MRCLRSFSLPVPRKGVCLAMTVFATAAVVHQALAQMTESASVNADRPVHITISKPARPQVIPNTLFGSFLEPIGHSINGGLWANVVANPSFENGLWSARNVGRMLEAQPQLRQASQLGIPLPWQPLDPSQGNRYAPERGDAANSYQSVLIMGLPNKEVGLMQRVYLPVHRELKYRGSVWIKHVRGNDTTVDISLRRDGRADQTLTAAKVTASADTWTKYPFQLDLKQGQLARLEPADLVISLSDNSRVMVDNLNLDPNDAIDGMDPDEVAMARKLHTTLVRFGGNFTSGYNWRDGIGPQDRRVSMTNIAWGIPEYDTFGTNEFLKFCELIHAQPQIALNLGTGTPQEATDWVSYVDKHWGDHNGGLLWELGNELWGNWQIGYPTLQEVAARTLATSKAVRSADPKARLIATGADEDHFHEWNAQQLTLPAGSFRYLSTHFVVGDTVELPHASLNFRTMAALALPWGLSARMHAIQAQAAAAGHKNVNVAFTEWLLGSRNNSGPSFINMGGALFAGGFLNMVMRNSDVVKVSDMTGIMEFGGIWKERSQVYGAPAYWVLRDYATAAPRFLLQVKSDSPTYSISKGVTRLPEIPDVPYLDVIAAESKDRTRLLLFCVNRDLTRPMKADFDLSALGTASEGSVKIQTVTASDIFARNSALEPEQVRSVAHTAPVQGKFSYTFPNASVTVMELPLKQ